MGDRKLSVIIPCRNAADTLPDTLRALSRQQSLLDADDWEVIVVDDASTDHSLHAARRFRDVLPNLRTLRTGIRRGSSHARNAGARVATGRWLVWCDADDVAGIGWLDAMVQALREHHVVASRFDGSLLNAGSPVRPLGQTRALERLWYPPYLDHAGGSGLGVWREVHEALAGFDEGLGYLVDTDYTIRAQLEGYRVHLAHDALMHVRFRPTYRGLFHQARRWARSNMILYHRYGDSITPPRREWKRYSVGLVRLLRKIRRTGRRGSDGERATIVWKAGWHLGLLEGAIRCGVAPIAAPWEPRRPGLSPGSPEGLRTSRRSAARSGNSREEDSSELRTARTHG